MDIFTRFRIKHMILIFSFFYMLPAQAALITFDTVVSGATYFAYDGDGDLIDDVIFSTTDISGFNTAGPGPNMTYINEPGIEGTSLLNPDLRVDFLNGAIGSLSFGFALDSSFSDPSFFGDFRVFDSSGNLIASALEIGDFTPTNSGTSSFPEGLLDVSFSGVASYALFDFTSEFGRYIIDNFEGTFGSTEIPEPSIIALFGVGIFGLGLFRRRL